MPSRTYDMFAEALTTRRQVHCIYGGYPRVLCPIILGHSKGEEVALAFQIGGRSSKPLSPRGEWRCLKLANVSEVELRDGPWRAGGSHEQAQSCVEDVDLDANPESPYSPRRRGR